MKRLTEEIWKGKYTYAGKDKSTKEYDLWVDKVIQKLGKLEDLEEEIGCPLEAVFKALKQDYVYTNVGKRGRLAIGFYGDFLALFYGKYEMLRVSNYKKTWWLKEDKSE